VPTDVFFTFTSPTASSFILYSFVSTCPRRQCRRPSWM
jgi:hypothetical protein